MSTDYPGRESENDLGGGVSFVWMRDQSARVIGLHSHHPPNAEDGLAGHAYCGGYICWVSDPPAGTVANHQLLAGGPGDENRLTVHPSLLCRRCGFHGWIQGGRWIPA